MHARQLLRAAALAGVILAAAGCATVPQSSVPTLDGDDAPLHATSILLPERQREFASALAAYSMAVRDELHENRAGALSNYLAAAALDASNEALQFRVALGLIQEKRTDEAVRIMERAVERSPTDRSLIWQALVYRASERDADALRAYRRAMTFAPSNQVPYLEAASLLAKAGDQAGAIRTLQAGQPLVATNTEPEIVRAIVELQLREASAAAAQGGKSGQLAAAVETAAAAVKRWPDDQALLLMLGNLHAVNNDLQAAIAIYNDLERRNPDDLNIKEKLAVSLMASGNRTGAVAALEAIAAKQPANPKVYYYLGELHEQLGETNSAIANYTKAGEAGNDDPVPFMKAAILHVGANRYADAERVIRRGLDSLPDSPRLLEMLAYVLMDQRRYAEALACFDKVAGKLGDPAAGLSKRFRLNHAIAQQLGGNTSDAPRTLRQAMRDDAQAFDVFIAHMMRDASTNNQATVAETMARLQVLDPQDARLPMFRGVFLNAAGDHAGAVAAYAEAEALATAGAHPERIQTSPFYFWYGAAADEAGNTDLAARMFQRSIAIQPENTEARNYLAYMWACKGVHLDEAMVQINRALQAEPENAAFLDTLGWIHFKRGDFEQARLTLERSLERMADNAEVLEHMGDVLKALRRDADALIWWKKAWDAGSRTDGLREKLKGAGVDPAPSTMPASQTPQGAVPANPGR